jgi:hypothetical protein
MSMSPNARTFVAVIASAIVVYLITLTMPLHDISPKGIVLPIATGQKVLASSDQVMLFNQFSAPLTYRSVGWVNIEFHSLEGDIDAEQRVQTFAQKLAAKAGGNGVIVNVKGHTLPSTSKELSMQVLRGQVILQPASNL